MAKKTYLDTEETQRRVLKGIQDLAGIVGKTLGPGGRPILLHQENRPPLSTKDGVTVARFYKARGDIENLVVDAAKEVCERTNRSCGDGTTTAIVLAAALVDAGQEWLSNNPGQSPQRLARDLKSVFDNEVLPRIKDLARPIKNLPLGEGKEVIRRVALVSANHDEQIAYAVSEAVGLVGEDGMVNSEEGTGAETKVVHEMGFPFDSGLEQLGSAAAASFVNRKDKGDCFIEGSYVALYDGEILDVNTIAPLLNKIVMEKDGEGHSLKCPVAIVAHGFSDQVLKMMAQNFRQGILTMIPIKSAANGQNLGRSQFLHDLAAYVGGVVHDSQGSPLQSASIGSLGFVESIKVGSHQTIMMGEPEQEKVETRIAELKAQMEGASEFDRSKIRYRVGRLTGGVATIYAGGATALEAKERYARVVDAVSAVRSAMDMGVVPGGGCTLLSISRALSRQEGAAEIFADALEKPFWQILDNAGMSDDVDPDDIGISAVLNKSPPFKVYNALTGEYVEWWDAGILDPAKVTITALENALSVAQLLMTLGGLIVEESNEDAEKIQSMQDGLMKAINQQAME